MIGFRTLAATAALVYALMAATTMKALWFVGMPISTLHEIAVLWLVITVVVGGINWILEP